MYNRYNHCSENYILSSSEIKHEYDSDNQAYCHSSAAYRHDQMASRVDCSILKLLQDQSDVYQNCAG